MTLAQNPIMNTSCCSKCGGREQLKLHPVYPNQPRHALSVSLCNACSVKLDFITHIVVDYYGRELEIFEYQTIMRRYLRRSTLVYIY